MSSPARPDSLPALLYMLGIDLDAHKVPDRKKLGYVLRAATLVELGLRDNLADSDGKVQVTREARTGDAVLDTVLGEIAGDRGRKWKYWVRLNAGGTLSAVESHLVGAGAVQVRRRTLLADKVEVADPVAVGELRQRVLTTLTGGRHIEELDPYDVALTALAANGAPNTSGRTRLWRSGRWTAPKGEQHHQGAEGQRHREQRQRNPPPEDDERARCQQRDRERTDIGAGRVPAQGRGAVRGDRARQDRVTDRMLRGRRDGAGDSRAPEGRYARGHPEQDGGRRQGQVLQRQDGAGRHAPVEAGSAREHASRDAGECQRGSKRRIGDMELGDSERIGERQRHADHVLQRVGQSDRADQSAPARPRSAFAHRHLLATLQLVPSGSLLPGYHGAPANPVRLARVKWA